MRKPKEHSAKSHSGNQICECQHVIYDQTFPSIPSIPTAVTAYVVASRPQTGNAGKYTNAEKQTDILVSYL